MGTFRSEQDNKKYRVSDVWYFSTLDEHFDPATFPDFPKKPGQIEESRLEEESEADPLVVLVVFLLPCVLMTISPPDAGSLDTRVGLGLLQLRI